MSTQEKAIPAARKTNWLKLALLVLIVEKIVQHLFVTLAFFFDWGSIQSTVAVDPDLLMILGAAATVLFGFSLWGMLARKPWTPVLVAGLALFDIFGEFVAQGKIGIALNVSFLVAILLFALAVIFRRNQGTSRKG